MTSIARFGATNLLLAAVAGLSLGYGLAGVDTSNVLLAVSLIILASIGEWLEVRLGPLGAFTLRPVIAFVGLWIGGPALLMVTGILPVFLGGLLARKSALWESLVSTGKDSLAFWTGYLFYSRALWWLGSIGPQGELGEVVARSFSFIGFWVVEIPLQALELTASEGIRLVPVLRHLGLRAWPHVAVLAIGAVALSYIETSFGLIVMGFAAAMLVEAYYPWKLLGQQGGVLLTGLQMMAQAVDLKDPYTSNHSQRVSRYAVRIARVMGLPEDEVDRIRIGALMHDLGKIGISGRIIRKPGKLTPGEQALMRQHSSVSADIIGPLEILGESAEIVRHHHENWDGSGYPDGLRGEDIPLGSRVILAGDAFDALVTDRPYRRGASRAEALVIIRKNAGTQFDPIVVDALERIANQL